MMKVIGRIVCRRCSTRPTRWLLCMVLLFLVAQVNDARIVKAQVKGFLGELTRRCGMTYIALN